MPKISELPALATPATDSDLLALVNGGITKKMTLEQLSDFIDIATDNLFFAGNWNAMTNTPPLTSGAGTKGSVYFVNIAGNTALDSYTNWHVGDWAVFNGTQWQKVQTNNQPPIGNIVYVNAATGDNTIGNGSINYPYANISTAMASITTNAFNNPFTIIVSGRISEPGILRIKPWVSIVGESQITVIDNSNPIELDPSFGVGTHQPYLYMENISCNNLTFDCSTFTNTVDSYVQLDTVYCNDITTNSSATNTLYFYIYNSYINIINGSNTGFICFSTIIANELNMGLLPYVNTITSLDMYGSDIVSLSLTAPGSLGYFPSFLIRGTQIRGAITIDGAKCILGLDTSTYKAGISATNGATVNLINIADGLNANFIPTNYTPVNVSVKGHLEGINTKLGSLGNLIYLGLWNAATNTPTITSSVGTLNQFYIVSTSGTTSIDGINTWNQNDWIYFNGTVWTRIAFSVYNQLSAASLSALSSSTNLNIGTNLTTGVLNLGNTTGTQTTNINSPLTNAINTVRITNNGANPFLALGDDTGTSGVVYGRSAGVGSYFTNAAAGDACLRQGTTSRKLLMGVGSTTSQIQVNNTTINFNVPITLPTTGGTAANLSYYEETNHVTDLTGAGSVVGYTIRVRKINDQTVLFFPPFTFNCTATDTIQAVTPLSTRFRPANNHIAFFHGTAGVNTIAMVQIETNGNITFYANEGFGVFTVSTIAAIISGSTSLAN